MNENALRIVLFLALFALFSGAEALFPRRVRLFSRRVRWPSNFVMVFLGAAVGRVLPAFIPLSAAIAAEKAGFGLFHLVKLPSLISFILTLLFLDLVIYWQHRLFHKLRFLWKIHRIHHSIYRVETDSNYGFSLSWWDFIFRSYTESPRDGQIAMKIGQKGFDDQKHLLFPSMLALPFSRRGG